jgi:Anti-sigma factor NepR
MYLAAQCRRPVERHPVRCSTDREIRDFLNGKTDGENLLHALYDHVLDEAVPERLTALLRRRSLLRAVPDDGNRRMRSFQHP